MDIRSAIINQLNTDSLQSLIIQNHLYGCFILMEDIAERKVDVDGTIISTPKFTFDLDKQFSEIGLRYGFAMDTKLALSIHPEYKDLWLTQFKDIDFAQNIEEVDRIEESLIEVIRTYVTPGDEFFISALGTGILPQEWIEKVLKLLNPDDVEIQNNAISVALTEKPIRRKLSTTRRAKPLKKSKTRRNR